MSKLKKGAQGTRSAGGGVDVKNPAVTVDTENSKEVKRLAAKAAGNEVKNAKKIANKAIDAERMILSAERKIVNAEKTALRNFSKEKKAVVWKSKTKSELETIRIIEEGKENGVALSVADARLIKQENRIQAKLVHGVQGTHYFNTLEQRVGKRGFCIVLMSVIWLIQAKCPMPKAARSYWIKSVALAKAQTLNTLGYFTPAFANLALMIASNVFLIDTINNFEDKDGTATSQDVDGAVAATKIYVDELIFYINGLCKANQTDAPAIISNAQMEQVKQKATNTKPDFSIKQLEASGEIKLTSLSGKFDDKPVPTTYYWQYGLMTAAGMQWFDLPNTINRCSTIAVGMPLDVTVSFRKATQTTKGGRSGWCTPINISPK